MSARKQEISIFVRTYDALPSNIKRFGRKLVNLLPKSRVWDNLYHRIYFFVAHQRIPRRSSDLFNDYLFFLKIDGGLEDPARQLTSDKILVKGWIEEHVGNGLVPNTMRILDNQALDVGDFPPFCVAKPSHLSGLAIFVGEKIIEADLALLEQSFHRNLYNESREENYKNLKPRIICEEIVADQHSVVDYKFFCFHGRPKIIQVDVGRHQEHVRSLYTTDWERLEIQYGKPSGPHIQKPERLQEMLRLAQTIATFFESVRVDFYIGGDRVLIGELTHCPEQGHGRFGSLQQERLFSTIYFS